MSTDSRNSQEAAPQGAALKQLLAVQFRVGCLGFGGPIAAIAMMMDEFCDRRELISRRRFNEGLALVKLLPGPISTMMSVFLGQELAGWVGGLLSAIVFVLPSAVALLLISIFEESMGPALRESRVFHSVLDFLQISVLAIIAQTCWKLFRDSHKALVDEGRPVWMAALFALVAALLAIFTKWPEPVIVLTIGIFGFFLFLSLRRSGRLQVDPFTLFLTFFIAGTTVFGTGYMVLPYLQRVLVEQHAWMSNADFANAIVYGNLTPGPVLIASTYMGYRISGLTGALIATFGIFVGPIVLMLILGPIFRRYLDRPWMAGILAGVIPSVAAIIAANIPALGRNLAWAPVQWVVLVGATVLAFRKLPALKIMALAGALGALWALIV